jgi:threonine/homoserine/homoserine lactone efflux protein
MSGRRWTARRWDIKRAVRIGAGCGLGAAAYQTMAAGGWAGIDSNAITQILAAGIGGAFCFWLATKIRNWWVVDRPSRVARRCE